MLPADSPLLTDEIQATCYIGDAFTSTSDEAAPIKDLIAATQLATSFVIICLPALLPIDWDSDLVTGAIEDNMFQHFRDHYGTLGALWLTAASDHNSAIQLAAIAGKATLGTIFPNHRANGTTYNPTSSTIVMYPSPNDEDALAGDLHALDTRLASASPATKPPPANGGIPDSIGIADDNSKSIAHCDPVHTPIRCPMWTSDASLVGVAITCPLTGPGTFTFIHHE